jgi:hypothetical protein
VGSDFEKARYRWCGKRGLFFLFLFLFHWCFYAPLHKSTRVSHSETWTEEWVCVTDSI